MSTPHISASKADIAKIVLMAGDPLRAKVMAHRYLKNVKLVSEVRNELIFTGDFKGTKVTIMGHGMGLSSIGIYAYELYTFYDVETIIRTGTCGSYKNEINVSDVVIASKGYTDSNYGMGFNLSTDTVDATKELLDIAVSKFSKSPKVFVGTVNASNWFYRLDKPEEWKELAKKGVLAVDMEVYALYAIAKALGKKALVINTVSDSLVKLEFSSSKTREEEFGRMYEMALEIATNKKVDA